MKTYLQLALAAAAFVALSSAANIKEGPVGERPDGREEGGEDTLALVVVGKQHGGMVNDANQYSNIRTLRKRSPLVPVPFPFGDQTLKNKKKKKKLKKKLAAAAATTVTLASSGNPIPGVGSTIPLANPIIPSGASFSGPLSVLGLLMIGTSIVMAVSYFNAQNNQRRASDYGYGRSDYGYDKSDFGNNNNNQYAEATAGKIVPYIESSDIRYR